MKHIISLYDYTGVMGRPWAKAGYIVHCLDIQHPHGPSIDPGDIYPETGGVIIKHRWDRNLGVTKTKWLIDHICQGNAPVMIFGFPVCTDLAGSGARHWSVKAKANPNFQIEAAIWCKDVATIADVYSAPWCVENPKGALSRLWRKPDHSFHPIDYGCYIPEAEAIHPDYPDYIPPRDAYRKHTNLWTGNGFIMPTKCAPASPLETVSYTKANGQVTSGAPAWGKLGGKSQRTKNIRSATPRGFAQAVFQANHKED